MKKLIASVLLLSFVFSNGTTFASEKDYWPYSDFWLSESVFVSKDGKDFLFESNFPQILTVNGRTRINLLNSDGDEISFWGTLLSSDSKRLVLSAGNSQYTINDIDQLVGDFSITEVFDFSRPDSPPSLYLIQKNANASENDNRWITIGSEEFARYHFDGSGMKPYANRAVYEKTYGQILRPADFGKREGYEFWYKANGKTYVNLNGKDYWPFSDDNSFYSGGMVFNLKTKTVKGGDAVVFWKKVFWPYARVWSPQISFNRKGFAFIGTNVDSSSYVNVNGRTYGPFYGNTPKVALSGNGKKYVLVYGKWKPQYYDAITPSVVNVNGKTSEYELAEQPRISFDGSWFAFAFYKQGKRFVNVNGKRFGPYEFDWDRNSDMNDSLGFKLLELSDDGKGYAFSFEKGGKVYLNANGAIRGAYDSVRDLHVLSGGKSIGYAYVKDGKEYVSINGTDYGPYAKVWVLKFSDGWETWAFTHRDTKADDRNNTYVKVVKPNE